MSSSPMNVAALTAKACSDSSMRAASLVVTGSPLMVRDVLLMESLSVRSTLDMRHVRIGGSARCGFLQNPLFVQTILRSVDDHRHGLEPHGVLRRHEIAIDRIILVVGEIEDAVVDPAEAFLLHHRKMPLLEMDIGLGVALASGELLAQALSWWCRPSAR